MCCAPPCRRTRSRRHRVPPIRAWPRSSAPSVLQDRRPRYPPGLPLPPRVRAHVFLCILAYHLEWHLRQALAPMLFDDHDRAAAEAQRAFAVAKAQPSPAAKRKAASKLTDDDLPVHSFRSLLADLATLTRNTVRFGRDTHNPRHPDGDPTPRLRSARRRPSRISVVRKPNPAAHQSRVRVSSLSVPKG